VRTALTGEMWDTINSAWIDLQEIWGKGTKTREELTKFLRFVQETSLRFDGSAYRTMLRNDAYWFSRLGLHLERADNTAASSTSNIMCCCRKRSMSAVRSITTSGPRSLRSVSALTAYHWVYRETLKPWLIADLLILKRLAAAVAGELLRQSGAQPRPDRRRLWPPGSFPAPCPRGAHGLTQPHGRYLPARRARIQSKSFISDNSRLGEIITKQYLI